jgi:hypothetical protein
MAGKMTVKGCKTGKQIIRQLLQTGTDEKPSSKTVSQVLLIFYNSINDKMSVITLMKKKLKLIQKPEIKVNEVQEIN